MSLCRHACSRGQAPWVEGLEPICAGLISGAALVGIGNAVVNLPIRVLVATDVPRPGAPANPAERVMPAARGPSL